MVSCVVHCVVRAAATLRSFSYLLLLEFLAMQHARRRLHLLDADSSNFWVALRAHYENVPATLDLHLQQTRLIPKVWAVA